MQMCKEERTAAWHYKEGMEEQEPSRGRQAPNELGTERAQILWGFGLASSPDSKPVGYNHFGPVSHPLSALGSIQRAHS